MTRQEKVCRLTESHVTGVQQASTRVKVTNHIDERSIQQILPMAEKAIGVLANPDAIRRIAARNADSIWLFSRIDAGAPEGFQAFLLLNARGRSELIEGTLDLLDPPVDRLVSQSETPAAIYVWAAYTPGILAAGMDTMLDHFASPRYAHVDMYARAASARGERSITRIGFRPGVPIDGAVRPGIFVWPRAPKAAPAPRVDSLRPRYDSYGDGATSGITVAHSIEEFMKVTAIRSAVYIGEQNCPYDEEFDGNDFAATHLLAYVDGEPVGCMRARFFRDFAKLERLALRREYRTSKMAFRLVRAGVDLCRAKGYGTIYGHARVELLPFWKSFGFTMATGQEEFSFSGERYVELTGQFEPTNDSVKLEDGPFRTIRPEGRWHRPGILEGSRSHESHAA